MKKHKDVGRVLFLALLLAFLPIRVYAQSSSSNNYRVDQTFFGTGGELDAQSGSFRARQTLGELAIGQTDSSLYRAFAGFNTTDEPFIEFVVTASNIDLGYLSDTAASTANGQFYVRAWQAGGYVVRSESDPPTNTANPSIFIDPLTTPAASDPGTEQFGINVVENSCPTPAVSCASPFGADPYQDPDPSFSSGEAEPGYDTPDLYQHNKGDIIARSPSSSSVTLYTISYLFNISDVTESGEYRFNHILVATGTY